MKIKKMVVFLLIGMILCSQARLLSAAGEDRLRSQRKLHAIQNLLVGAS